MVTAKTVTKLRIMSLNPMILCSKLKIGPFKIVIKSQVVTKFNVTTSRVHCIANRYQMYFKETNREAWTIRRKVDVKCHISKPLQNPGSVRSKNSH